MSRNHCSSIGQRCKVEGRKVTKCEYGAIKRGATVYHFFLHVCVENKLAHIGNFPFRNSQAHLNLKLAAKGPLVGTTM